MKKFKIRSLLVEWMNEDGIICGSCNGYNLYTALQEALKREWYGLRLHKNHSYHVEGRKPAQNGEA